MSPPAPPSAGSGSLTDRALRLFADVKAGEGPRAIVLMVTLFLILSSYYVLKTVREGLILAGGTSLPGVGVIKGDELKIGATGAMALLMLIIIPAYGNLASRVDRKRLLEVSYLAIVGSLAGFFILGAAGASVGLWFFIWLGIVNMFVIAQFWSYANDLHTEEQGKRLFAIIAIGGSLGAIVGPLGVKALTPAFGVFGMMGVAAVMFVVALVLLQVVEAMSRRESGAGSAAATQPVAKGGGFQLVLNDRYLLLIGAMLMLANLVNTTGEFILSHAARDHAAEVVPATAALTGEALGKARGAVISEFYADFFFWVNLVGFLIQSFLASRIIKHAGVRLALLVLPTIAFLGYGLIGAASSLLLLRVIKTAENSTDYSLQNTVRQSLFLPTSREVKYKAKAALDTFFVRFGDTAAALIVLGGINFLDLGPAAFAFINVAVGAAWIVTAIAIGRRYERLAS